MSKQLYKLIIEPITCVHIGTGVELSPLDYKMEKSSKGRSLYVRFSSDSILHRIAMDPKLSADFEAATAFHSMKTVQKFYHKNFNPNEDILYLCHATNEFEADYDQNREADPLDKAYFVEQMYRPEGKMTPVIPGSSVKGAIRTAVLSSLLAETDDEIYNRFCDELADCRSEHDKDKLNAKIQKELLGNYSDAKNDPFRAVEISDCSFKSKNTQIVGMLKSLSLNKQSGDLFVGNSIKIRAEALKGYFMDNPNVAGDAILRINTDLQKVKDGVKKALSVNKIIDSCNYFFWREFENEYEKFYSNATTNCDLIKKLYEELKKCKEADNQFIIRVGHWSQVEFVTLEERLRSPKTRMVKGRELPSGTTRTVFDYDGQYLPLGWCKCRLEKI